MLNTEIILAFSLFNLPILLLPSAEMIIVITQSSLHGRAAGIAFIFGICMALVFQVILAAVGVSAIIQTSPVAFTILKIIGVTYLIYLAWQALTQPFSFAKENSASIKFSQIRLFWKGVFVNISNPITPIYLLVTLPIFIAMENGSYLSQALQLGLVLIIIFLMIFLSMSIIAEKFGNKLIQSKRAQMALQKVTGLFIALFALIIALSSQDL